MDEGRHTSYQRRLPVRWDSVHSKADRWARRGVVLSYCRMRGAIAVSADLDGINIAQGSELPDFPTYGLSPWGTALTYKLLRKAHGLELDSAPS